MRYLLLSFYRASCILLRILAFLYCTVSLWFRGLIQSTFAYKFMNHIELPPFFLSIQKIRRKFQTTRLICLFSLPNQGSLGSEVTGNVSLPNSAKQTTGLGTSRTNRISTEQSGILEAPIIPPLPLYVLLAVDKLRASDMAVDGNKLDKVFGMIHKFILRTTNFLA